MVWSCTKTRWLKAFSVLTGLSATALLAVAIVISTWIHIEELAPVSDYQLMQLPAYEGQVAEKRSMEVGLWTVCLTKSYIKWKKENRNQVSYTVLSQLGSEGPNCWYQSPFKKTVPEDAGMLRVADLVDLLEDQHFNIPLFTSLGMVIVALLVTAGGMVRNNVVIIAGAAIYEFSSLVLGMSLLWFYRITQYAPNPSDGSYTHYFGSEHIAIGLTGIKRQVRHCLGPALYCGIAAFVVINMAAAAGVVTHSVTSINTTRHKQVRREQEAIRKANNGQWLVTKL